MDDPRNEFRAGVTDEFSPESLPPISRKKFLALVAASTAFAAAGCNSYRDKGEIVPYVKKPDSIVPGVANLYASTCTGCAQSCGVLLKTREGRPVKVDGNPDHPINRGALCATGLSSLMGLYDPNRLRAPRGASALESTTWENADTAIQEGLDKSAAAGKEIALITGAVASPTAAQTIRDFLNRYPTARWYSYEQFHEENRRTAWEASYGSRELPAIAWEKARVILALESDFLGTEGFVVEQIGAFARMRDIVGSKTTLRLYAAEGGMSQTGANADYRIRIRPDALRAFIHAILLEAREKFGMEIPGGYSLQGEDSLETVARKEGLDLPLLRKLVGDLCANRGAGMVVAGSALPADLHVAVNALNEALGNNALFLPGEPARKELTPATEWKRLVASMKSGEVGVVIHFDANPLFHLPKPLGYQEGLSRVPLTVALVEQEDETSRACGFALPIHTMFESWGDFLPRAGVLSLQQPVVSPLYASRQKEGVLLSWTDPETAYTESLYHTYLMKRWEAEVYPLSNSEADFRPFWLSALHDGVIALPAAARSNTSFAGRTLSGEGRKGDFVLSLRQSHFLGDGRFANNGWLQELPHPISKVVWDNYAAISPASAAALGITTNDMVEIKTETGTQSFPVFVQPGQADGVVSIELGYGRTEAGPIGTDVGTNAQILLPLGAIDGPRIISGVRVTKADGKGNLVTTQEHHILDEGPLSDRLKDIHLKRKIIREGTLEEYRKEPDFLQKERPELFSIAQEVEYKGVKWAMSIDLNKCVGCNACVAGCNVENNIPVVGKDQVDRGREMQWIRIDRYYAGSPENPTLSHQPMLCQHCDNAPCENVCPVVATTHSPDGLNQMVYNRCVGTKYCSNNCPYKVRRFNFYDFRDQCADGYYTQDPVGLMHNPEVTVRSRGVMEKCTFCVQRISEARQHAAEQGRRIEGKDVTTACQQACPAQAIEFGDMNDPASDVSAHRKHPLGYSVLEELNVRPNVTYLARLRNHHPETHS